MNISERDPGFLVVDSCVDSNGVFVSLDVDGRVLSGLDLDVTAHVADASHMLAWNATPNDDEIPLEGHFQSLSTGFLISSSDGAWRIGSDWKAVEVDLGVEGNSVRRVSSSVDGKILIGGYDGRCRIFSSNLLFIEEYLGNLADSSEFEFITSVCFSPDGTCVLSASEGGVHLWSVGDSTISTIINSSCRIGCFCGSGDVLVENLNVCGQADVYNSDGSVKKASIPGLGGAIESGFSGDFGSILSYTNGGLLWVGKDYCAVEKMQVSGFVKRWINVDSSQCIGVLSTGKIIVVET